MAILALNILIVNSFNHDKIQAKKKYLRELTILKCSKELIILKYNWFGYKLFYF